MPAVNKDIDGVLSLDSKKKLLQDIQQEDLLQLFKDEYKEYKPIKQKKVALDQSVTIAITDKEKEELTNEVLKIKKEGGKVSLSSVMRNRVLIDPDIIGWKENALEGLKELNGPDWDKRAIERERDRAMDKYDNVPMDDDETQKVLQYKIDECNRKLIQLKKPNIKRGYRLRGRVTFNEANTIRWRAARLNLTVADYMRFLIFNYEPFTEDDKTLSVDARKRFYISILDVAANGWGTPPEIESCPNCVRHIDEIKELKDKLKRLQDYSSQ